MWLNPDTPPERPALISGDTVIRYGELAERATLLAQRLAALGVGGVRAGRVALLGSNSIETVTAIHALTMLGATLIALNTRLTQEELTPQLARTRPQLLLCDGPNAALAAALAAHAPQCFMLNAPAHGLPAHGLPAHGLPCIDAVFPGPVTRFLAADPEAIAAILFTSGTSGIPKAAELSVRSFDAAAHASAERLGVYPDDVWLSVLPLFHVGGLNIVRRSALYGTAIDLHARFDPGAITRRLNTQTSRITLISVVPTMLTRLIDAGARPVPPFRLALLGGAAATPELIDRAQAAGFPIATTYGLTEACSQVATAPPDLARRKPASVGKALPGIRIEVRHPDGGISEPGETGEIAVHGPTLMRGYLDDPVATAASIQDGWLLTGDIGCKDHEGDLFVLQRRSDLIITGGENVYPAEVEAVLRAHPAVADCAVVGLPSKEWGQQVAALLVQNASDQTVSPADLLQALERHCRERLAGYKLPRVLRLTTALPLNAAGKVDRQQVVVELQSVR
jgi:o-succinylbenzoate---CoA ligase